jgi:membrane protease YdiL (CAAX protease family)
MITPTGHIPATTEKQTEVRDVVFCTLALMLFGFFITASFPLKLVAFPALIFVVAIISSQKNRDVVMGIFAMSNLFSLQKISWYVVSLLMGVAGALFYRGSIGMPVFPDKVSLFAVFAILVGITEELVFRGFIQGRLQNLNAGFAIGFAALAHALYKAFLFISPWAQWHPGIFLFFLYSFGAFVLLGSLRQYSKSMLPPILVHAVFDIIVYAETTQPPWWVW